MPLPAILASVFLGAMVPRPEHRRLRRVMAASFRSPRRRSRNHRQDLRGLHARLSAARSRRRPGRRTSSSSSSTISASASPAPSAGRCRRPTLDKLAAEGLTLHSVPHHGDLLADARGAADRPQSSPGRLRHDHRARNGLSRLQRRLAARTRHRRRDAQGQWLYHGRLWQVAQYAGLGDQPGRPVRSLADRPRLRILLRLPGRRDQPVGAAALRNTFRSSRRRTRTRATT